MRRYRTTNWNCSSGHTTRVDSPAPAHRAGLRPVGTRGATQRIPLLLCLALLACGEVRSHRDTDGALSGAATGAVIDDAGRELHLATPPSRIVSLIPATTELLSTLGAADRLIARTDFDKDPALAGLPSVGPGLTPSVEWLVSLRPELVIAWPDSRDRGLTAQLEALGIPTYSAQIESLDDIVTTTRRLGAILGLAQRADSLVRAIEAGFGEVRDAVAGRGRPTVFYVVGHEPPMTAGPGTFLDELIELAGGRNLFHDTRGWAHISLEEVLRRRPELIIVPFGEGNAPTEQLARQPGWRELDAVRTRRVYSIDADVAHRPGPRIAEVARMIAGMIHPEAFAPEARDLEASAPEAGTTEPLR